MRWSESWMRKSLFCILKILWGKSLRIRLGNILDQFLICPLGRNHWGLHQMCDILTCLVVCALIVLTLIVNSIENSLLDLRLDILTVYLYGCWLGLFLNFSNAYVLQVADLLANRSLEQVNYYVMWDHRHTQRLSVLWGMPVLKSNYHSLCNLEVRVTVYISKQNNQYKHYLIGHMKNGVIFFLFLSFSVNLWFGVHYSVKHTVSWLACTDKYRNVNFAI